MESAHILVLMKKSDEALIPKKQFKKIMPTKKKKTKKTITTKKKKPGRRTCMLRKQGEVGYENGIFKVEKDIRCISSTDKKGRPVINRASVRCDICYKFFCFPKKHDRNCFEKHKHQEKNEKCKNATYTLISDM